jgi:LCP family protein required for cell wall assembly
MIEEELKAAFARHENLAPTAAPTRRAIDRAVVRRRRRRLGAVAAAGALTLVAGIGAPLAAAGHVRPPDVIGQFLPRPADADRDGPVTLLVLGIDGENGSHRADTVMVVHLPADGDTAYLLSLPRDLLVEVPGVGRARLSEAFFFGSYRRGTAPDFAAGTDLTAATVVATTGLPVDGTITLRYGGLRRLTDAVGGVRICLDRPVTSRHTGREFPAACQRLDGSAALDLLRQRYGLPNGTYDRDANGRAFARALLDRAMSGDVLTNPVRMHDVLRAAGQGLTVRGGVSTVRLARLAGDVDELVSVDIGSTYRAEVVDGIGYERLDEERSAPVFAAIRDHELVDWVADHPEAVGQR